MRQPYALYAVYINILYLSSDYIEIQQAEGKNFGRRAGNQIRK